MCCPVSTEAGEAGRKGEGRGAGEPCGRPTGCGGPFVRSPALGLPEVTSLPGEGSNVTIAMERLASAHSSCCSASSAPTSRTTAVRLGKMPTTPVRPAVANATCCPAPASVSATLGWWRDTHRCRAGMQRSAADDHHALCGACGAGYASHSARIAASWTHTPKSALDTALKSPEPVLVRRSFRAPHNQRCHDALHPSEVRCHVRTNAQQSTFVTLQDDDHRCGVVVLWC